MLTGPPMLPNVHFWLVESFFLPVGRDQASLYHLLSHLPLTFPALSRWLVAGIPLPIRELFCNSQDVIFCSQTVWIHSDEHVLFVILHLHGMSGLSCQGSVPASLFLVISMINKGAEQWQLFLATVVREHWSISTDLAPNLLWPSPMPC